MQSMLGTIIYELHGH